MRTDLLPLLPFALLISLCTALIREDEIYLTIQIPSNKVECFYVPITKPEYKAMEFSYTVSRGSRDISLTVRDPRDVEVVADERKQYHFHRIMIGSSENSLGDYSICMDNSYSYESKAVSLSLHLLDEKGDYVRSPSELKGGDPLQITVDVFETSTTRLMNNIDAADRLLVQIRVINNIDRSIAEQNFDRVNWYGTLNTFVILLSAVLQVLLVRSLLTEDSRVGRILRHGRK
uniref:GOLD domain-containing protein n=1 Tax=Haemonchus contortus TaxID=6289 RepID=A0A7I4YIX9_HAECO